MDEANNNNHGGDLLVNLFSGIGLGLLLGVIVGLSATPVVAGVVGAITSILAIFLGLEGGAESRPSLLGNMRLNGVRIGSFGFATVFGLLLGLYIRAQDPFADTVQQNMQSWLDAKFTPEEAKRMVMYERRGLLVEGLTETAGADHKKPVLYGVLEAIDACSRLAPERYGNAPEEILIAYRNFDKPMLQKVADQVDDMPKPVQLAVLTTLHGLICDLQRSES